MGGTTAQPLSAGDAVLGLVIELPGNSYQLEQRLEARFGSSRFSHATAYHALKRLSKQGLIRPIEDSSQAPDSSQAFDLSLAPLSSPAPLSTASPAAQSASSANADADVADLPATAYEATPAGIAHFRRWLRASTATPPVREELQAKISFCGPEDLPRMVAIVREAELACAAQLEDLNQRMRRQRLLDRDDAWRRLTGMIVTAGDVAWWDARIKWLQTLRQYLQREGQRYAAEQRQASSPPRD
jgi:DNA-binding PadR family transcriptional regulator